MLEVVIFLIFLTYTLCNPNKSEDLSMHVFYMIAWINELKFLIQHISCKYKCKFDGRKCNANQKWNNHKCRCECKNPKEHSMYEKGFICNPAKCSFENVKFVVGSIFDD